MNDRISKKQKWFNKINLTCDDELYIGIDVHKKSYQVALWLNDAPAIDFVMPADNTKVLTLLEKLRIAIRMIVYEAGPTGYSLARMLQKANLPINVIAPSKTPRPAARDSKTDTLDCRRLAEFAAKGLLRPIAIPTKHQEAVRQLCRLREQFVDKRKRTKLQIKSFLLQHGIPQPHGLASWSNASLEQLAGITLNQKLRYCLDMLLDHLMYIKARIKKIEKQLKETFGKKQYDTRIKILQTHPGVGPTISRQFATEIFNPKRFRNSSEVGKFVGLCPMIRQSGQTLRDGPILKTGRPQLRCNLVEAAWRWIAKDPHARKVYSRILQNTGQKNKAITAMARRLAINLWKMSCNNEPYRQTAQ